VWQPTGDRDRLGVTAQAGHYDMTTRRTVLTALEAAAAVPFESGNGPTPQRR